MAKYKEAPKKSVSSPTFEASSKKQEALPFGRKNYVLLAIGIALITLGFFLMSLDGFVDATKFSISLHLAPIVTVAGFVEVIYAILYNPNKNVEE